MRDEYDMIFKRKSFHLFRGVGNDRITEDELCGIREAFGDFDRLYPDTRTAIRIVPAEKVNFKRDAEYCILIYSENKPNYLLNAGYIGEQLDLWLVRHDIGSLWYGLGKPDEPTYDGLDFVIMLAVRKVNDPAKFRKDMAKVKRRPPDEIWSGDVPGAVAAARFAPSACNSQPWYVEHRDGVLTVYRAERPGRHGIMPAHAVPYFNRIDMGIFLCILELCLMKQGIGYDRELFTDDGGHAELTKTAVYRYREKDGTGT